jgi:hypothetical protein
VGSTISVRLPISASVRPPPEVPCSNSAFTAIVWMPLPRFICTQLKPWADFVAM